MNKIKILLIGIGGYGSGYAKYLLKNSEKLGVEITGAADPYAELSPYYNELKVKDTKIYKSPEEFYASNKADLAVISSPITYHEQQSILAMKNGSDVLLEKPIAATYEAANNIISARERFGRKLMIGFQWCFDDAMIKFKNDVEKGVWGTPVSMKALVLWHRDHAYYSRGTGWAGKKYNIKGEPVFDSIASNATAHYLENILWIAGSGIRNFESFALKANDIETYDTAVVKAELENGAGILYLTSHAVSPEENQDPMFEYKFSRGTVKFGDFGRTGDRIKGILNNGTEIDYGESFNNGLDQKIIKVIEYIRGERENPCSAENAMMHMDAVRLINEQNPSAAFFRQKDIVKMQSAVWVRGLAEKLTRSYKENRLPEKKELI